MQESNIAIEKESNIENLVFVNLKTPRLIPKILIESVKGLTFTPEEFYTYQEYQIDNENNFLYVLVDTSFKIHGYLWAEMSRLDRSLFVNTFSISREYWHKGKSIDIAIDFLKELTSKIKPSKVFWMTTNEKFFKKKGFKSSKICLMEYNAN